MAKPDPNKQKELSAASFKRVAKQLRVRARNWKTLGNTDVSIALKQTAAELDAEATLLRKMR